MGRKRGKPKGKKINPTFFIFCEGKTEEAYVSLLKSSYRLPSIIINTKVSGSSIDRSFINKYKKGKPTHEKDVDYLMYDADVQSVVERLQKIDNCELLLSNPCIELWFLLHYKNQTGSELCDYCCKELKNRSRSQYKKGEISKDIKTRLLEKVTDAVKRAKNLKEYDNPSSTLYKLIEDLEKAKK